MTKKEISAFKADIVSRVVSSAMTILHESIIYGSKLWPKQGFRAGRCWDKPLDDTIWFGVNPYGYEKTPVKGRIGFYKMDDFDPPRSDKQYKMIRKILDEAIYDGVYFEDEMRTAEFDRPYIWMTFTIQQN